MTWKCECGCEREPAGIVTRWCPECGKAFEMQDGQLVAKESECAARDALVADWDHDVICSPLLWKHSPIGKRYRDFIGGRGSIRDGVVVPVSPSRHDSVAKAEESECDVEQHGGIRFHEYPVEEINPLPTFPPAEQQGETRFQGYIDSLERSNGQIETITLKVIGPFTEGLGFYDLLEFTAKKVEGE